MASVQGGARQTGRQVATDHEGFLRHRNFRWLKIAGMLCLAALVGYLVADVGPRPNGGTWYGYTLGTLGAGLIVWLALLGVRKRAITPGAWSLKAWTSAHVYLGLALIVIGTLHAGFQLGWNVHSLAYVLMLLVILSGMFGVGVYALLPRALSDNAEQMTEGQMLDALQSLDRQLREAGQPLARHGSDVVIAALGESPLADSLWKRLGGGGRVGGATRGALDAFNDEAGTDAADPAIQRVRALLQRRLAQLDQIRRHMRLRALLEVWLYVHVPTTFALLAALSAHVISVFYYW